MAHLMSHLSADPAAASANASASASSDLRRSQQRGPRALRGASGAAVPVASSSQIARRALAQVEREWGEHDQPSAAAAHHVLAAANEVARRQVGAGRPELSPAASKSLAASIMMAHPLQAQGLVAQLASHGALSIEAQHELMRALRPASNMARPRARKLLEQRLPDSVALFLAKMQLEREKAVGEMLKAWGESLRKWSEIDRKMSEKAHMEASARARQLEAGLLAKLRMGPSMALRIDGPALRRILGPNSFGGPLAVESIGPSLLGAELIRPPANRMLLGAFVQPKVFLGFTVGHSQSAYFYAVAERAAQATDW